MWDGAETEWGGQGRTRDGREGEDTQSAGLPLPCRLQTVEEEEEEGKGRALVLYLDVYEDHAVGGRMDGATRIHGHGYNDVPEANTR